jgi:hypothetical protein
MPPSRRNSLPTASLEEAALDVQSHAPYAALLDDDPFSCTLYDLTL